MTKPYPIIEMFEITGRGTVVVIDEVTGRVPGVAYQAQLRGGLGERVVVEVFKILFLCRGPKPLESEAYLLPELHQQDVPDSAVLVFV